MNRNMPTETIRTIDLDREQLLVLEDRAGARIRVLSGGLWLTEEGRPDDRFARPGDELVLSEPGRAVLEGLDRSRIEVTPLRFGTLLERVGRRLGALRRSARRFALRGLASVAALVLSIGLSDLLARAFQQPGGGVTTHSSLDETKSRARVSAPPPGHAGAANSGHS
jgi:Protein of unknown function (DUF2917)